MTYAETLQQERRERLQRMNAAPVRTIVRRLSIVEAPPAPPPRPLPPRVVGRMPTLHEICSATCEHFGISVEQFFSERKYWRFARPRQVADYLANKMTLKSNYAIGQHLGGRDHSTVVHSVKQIGRFIQEDERLRASVEMLIDWLGSQDVSAQRQKRAILDHDGVRAIRASDEDAQVLADRHRISVSSVRNIKARRTWARVA